MTFRSFLDAAYAILVEDALRLGADINEVLDRLSRWVYRPSLVEADPVIVAEAATVAQNEESFAQLGKMMMAV